MQPTVPTETRASTAPRFYTTVRQPLRPEVVLLAIVVAVGAVSSMIFAMGQSGRARAIFDKPGAGRSATSGPASDDDKDDPSQIDTIVLADPTEAPVPGRKGNHVSPVHPTIVIKLPRYGDQVGLIPNTSTGSGQLLYAWLAAFNQASYPALREALPTVVPDAAARAQLKLRQQTGGFELLSAKEAEPGVLVFRLRDQTPLGTEVLGTLQVSPYSIPATIASFSLRDVPQRVRAAPPSLADPK